MDRAQIIRCRHGKIFAACSEPECYTVNDWKKDIPKYLKQGCTVDMVGLADFRFEKCAECDSPQSSQSTLFQ